MTIQPSVTIWTILCFLALMLVLDRLLFRPLLSFMDKRREKIDAARKEKADALREREEELSRRAEERAAAQRRAQREADDELEQVRQRNARAAAEKKADNERRLAEQKTALDQESAQILAAMEPRMDELVTAIVGRVSFWSREEKASGEPAGR